MFNHFLFDWFLSFLSSSYIMSWLEVEYQFSLVYWVPTHSQKVLNFISSISRPVSKKYFNVQMYFSSFPALCSFLPVSAFSWCQIHNKLWHVKFYNKAKGLRCGNVSKLMHTHTIGKFFIYMNFTVDCTISQWVYVFLRVNDIFACNNRYWIIRYAYCMLFPFLSDLLDS